VCVVQVKVSKDKIIIIIKESEKRRRATEKS
jgi:hypothetical protein